MPSARDLLGQGRPLTFLIGAGCSVEPPSKQPAGRAMMDALLGYFAPQTELTALIALKELRFEALVEAIAENADKDMKVIDYYALCNLPNAQHFFLAKQLQAGHFVMTTNFDFLIEHAALQSGIKPGDLDCVITRGDFTRHADPAAGLDRGRRAVYKVHGSTMNPISKEDTRPSLVATLQAFGSNKEGLDVFQLEPFKRPLFENITRGRSLVVMGYSGSDDFDIVPTLKVLKGIDAIIWIDHVQDDEGEGEVQEVTRDGPTSPGTASKVDRILDDIVRTASASHIYKVAVNTGRLIKALGGQAIFASKEAFSTPPKAWFEQAIPAPSAVDKLRIAWKVYYDLERLPDARRCAEAILRLREQAGESAIMCRDIGNMAITCMRMNDHPAALRFALQALEVAERTGTELSEYLNNAGEVYRHVGKYDDAIRFYERAIAHAAKEGEKKTRGSALHNVGLILSRQSRLDEALAALRDSLRISEELGDLIGVMKSLNAIGTVLENKRDPEAARALYERSLKIARELSRTEEIADQIANLANLDYARGDVDAAITQYDQALDIARRSGNDRTVANVVGNLGVAWTAKKDYRRARSFLQQKLAIVERTGDVDGQANVVLNIGNLLVLEGRFDEATPVLARALELKGSIGDLIGKGKVLINYLTIHKARKDTASEFKVYDQLVEVYTAAGDRLKLARTYQAHGNRSAATGDQQSAIAQYQKAVPPYEAIGDHKGVGEVNRAIAGSLASIGSDGPAIVHYQRAIDSFSAAGMAAEKAGCALEAGELHRKAGNDEVAVEVLGIAIGAARAAKDVAIEACALQATSLALHKLGRFADALRASTRAEALLSSPEGRGFQANVTGVLHYELKDYDAALPKYQQASNLLPGFPLPVYNMACVLAIKGDAERALAMLEKAVHMDPGYKAKAPGEPCFAGLKDSARFKDITG